MGSSEIHLSDMQLRLSSPYLNFEGSSSGSSSHSSVGLMGEGVPHTMNQEGSINPQLGEDQFFPDSRQM